MTPRDHKPKPLIAIDTQIAAWAYEPKPKARPDKVARAKTLMQKLEKRNIRRAIAIITLEELLRQKRPEKMEQYYKDFARTHFVLPHNIAVAIQAARIFQRPEAQRVMAKLEATKGKSKRDIYDDIKIIAAAVHFQVAEFYSDDGDFCRIGKEAGLDVRPLPSQGQLFQ